MAKPHPHPVRAFAEAYYILDRKDIAEIAVLLGVGESTLRRWRVEEAWDERRLPRNASGRLVANDLLIQIGQILDVARREARPVTHEEADGIKKLQSTAEQLDPKSRFRGHALDTLELLGRYVAEHHAELHPALTPILVDFARRLIEQPA